MSRQIRMKQSFEEYFNPEIFPSPPENQTFSPSSDKESLKENAYLFKGSLDDVDNWIKHEEFRLRKANSDSERKLREKNAKLAFRFSSIWAVFIGVIILLKGFEGQTSFVLTETEFIFIIGSLTASIFTFYLLVLKYLFYRPKNRHNER